MTRQNDQSVLDYILAVFPSELEILSQLGKTLRRQNLGLNVRELIDIEPVLVAELWMRRVLDRARGGELDVKGVFELSACLANEMPKIQAQREQELTRFSEGEDPLNEKGDIGKVA